MKSKRTCFFYLVGVLYGILCLTQSCQQQDELKTDLDLLKDRVLLLESATSKLNTSIESMQALLTGTVIVGVTEVTNGYQIELSDGKVYKVYNSESTNALLPLVSIDKDGYWIYSISNGTSYQRITDKDGKAISAYPTEGKEAASPMLRVDKDGYWQVSYDAGVTHQPLIDTDGNLIKATIDGGNSGINSIFKLVTFDKEIQQLNITLAAGDQAFSFPVIDTFYLKVKDGEQLQLFPLSEKRIYEVEQSDVDQIVVKAPEGWQVKVDGQSMSISSPSSNSVEHEDVINITILSKKNFIRHIPIQVKLLTTTYDANACKPWTDFVNQTADNKLLDFSYAGYKHGEVSPPDVSILSSSTALVGGETYTVYNVKDYGAIPNDAISDREALKAIILAIGKKYGKEDGKRIPDAKAVIYFPEGRYILHTKADNVSAPTADNSEKVVTETIQLVMGGVILKGAGRDKTSITMEDPSIPENSKDLYSCPPLLQFTNYNKVDMDISTSRLITNDSPKGTHTLSVDNASGFSVGEWVCLRLENNSQAVVAQELLPYSVEAGMTNLKSVGVQVWDYHQISRISGNTITFTEPLMHGVFASQGWKLCKYSHYENVGIEDITFVGKAKPGFKHHGDAEFDSGYTPLNLNRLTNSWIRRVGFTSVSAAAGISSCANLSAYDVIIDGNSGHSAITAQGSSRIFTGKVIDNKSSGGKGQFHACGVSKQSIGTVIWNVDWGTDACFESHATQPRATLIDACYGGFRFNHQGGDTPELPNHLADLTMWNFNAKNSDFPANFNWWTGSTNSWWRFLPPTIVGFHGANATFDPASVNLDFNHGSAVSPNSLYEAQLRKRLGYVPAWLNALK